MFRVIIGKVPSARRRANGLTLVSALAILPGCSILKSLIGAPKSTATSTTDAKDPEPEPVATPTVINLTVLNDTSSTLCSLFVNYRGQTDMGENLLERPLAAGAEQALEGPIGAQGRSPTLDARDCNGEVVMRVHQYGNFGLKEGTRWSLEAKDWGAPDDVAKSIKESVFKSPRRNATLVVGAAHSSGFRGDDLVKMGQVASASKSCTDLGNADLRASCAYILERSGSCSSIGHSGMQQFCKATFDERSCDSLPANQEQLCKLTFSKPRCYDVQDNDLKQLCMVGVNGALASTHCGNISDTSLQKACSAL